MTDPQQIRESIRSFLGGVDQTNTPEMAEVAVDYAASCRVANDRLRRCVDYLRRGHRSEAIHLAEAHPNLLDVSASLDIPELAEWEALCAGYGWPRPLRILVESAQELNEAYVVEQTLQPLLARHRRLALEDAPLGERLMVLRDLIKSDPGNVGWDADVAAYEKVRIQELNSESLMAIRSKSVVAVDRLLAEVSEQPWRAALPVEIISRLTDASNGLHREKAVADLRALLPQLHAAYAAMSYPECKQIIAQWCAIVTQFKVTVPDDLREEMRPVNDWLTDQQGLRERQRQVKRASDVLRTAMDAEVPLVDLQRLYRDANGFDLEIPEDLEREYRRKLAAFERAENVRRRTLLTILLIFTGAVVAIVWLLYRTVQGHS